MSSTRRNVVTPDGPARLTTVQYSILRFWADNTNDRGRQYTAERGPAPRMHDRTEHLLTRRKWISSSSRNGFEARCNGWIVTDAGRAAVGLAPVHRDSVCPIPRCRALPGERCMDGTLYVADTPGGRQYLPYIDSVHPARRHPGLYERIRRESLYMATDDDIYAKMRETLGLEAARQAAVADNTVTRTDVLYALDGVAPHLSARLRSAIEPGHLGFICAT